MLQSICSFFDDFIEWLDELGVLPSERLAAVLDDLGGLDGVREDELYISALEEIGRYIVNSLNRTQLYNFLLNCNDKFSVRPDEFYYFFESLIDEVTVKYSDGESFISNCPPRYQPFLIKRFI